MNHTFQMHGLFGSFLADGDIANRFRFCEVEPKLENCTHVIFDFSGVINMTDSFCRACFETLATRHPEQFRNKIRFQHCSPLIRSFLSNAVASGLSHAHKKAA